MKINSGLITLKCLNGHIYDQDRRNLLQEKSCNECYKNSRKITLDMIIKKINNLHGNNFKYDLSNFKNLHTKIKIECKKGHIFNQKISNHLQGKGCPICRESLGERAISNFLEKNNISHIKQKKFKDCKFINQLPFDFYLPDYNLCIEYDGIQHFKPMKMFGGEKEFKKTKIKDDIKNKYCSEHNIKLIRISDINKINEELFNTVNKLIIL